MTVLQAALISLLCYAGSLTAPWLIGCTGGWYTLTRPLVASLFVGLILGDVKTGITIGVAVQAVFIGLITPGGTVPSDLSFVSFLGIPLAMVAGAEPEVAVSIAVGFGIVGVAIWQILSVGNAWFAHRADEYAEEGEIDKIIALNYWAQIPAFILRGVLPFIILITGASVAGGLVAFLENQIPWLMTYLGLVGGALPAVGIAILVQQIAPDSKMILWLLIGWALVSLFKLPIVGVAVVGAMIAAIYFMFLADRDQVTA
ncbi:MAG: PTS sugar transporter subunit IIC [Anaerolineaceae bacterium]|nr:PTS sugar transporter subunit IIC [Anaerolineaceae bacterium]